MKTIIRYALSRLTERSTVAGLLVAVTSIGVNVAPELAQAIGSTVTAVAGLALALMPTGGKPDAG